MNEADDTSHNGVVDYSESVSSHDKSPESRHVVQQPTYAWTLGDTVVPLPLQSETPDAPQQSGSKVTFGGSEEKSVNFRDSVLSRLSNGLGNTRVLPAGLVNDFKELRAQKTSFYGREKKDVFSFRQFSVSHNFFTHVCLLIIFSLLAFGGMELWMADVAIGGSVVSFFDAMCFCVLGIDYHTIGMRKTMMLSLATASVSSALTYVMLVTVGLGMRALMVVIVCVCMCRLTRTKTVLKYRWVVAIVLLASAMVNFSAAFFSLGEVAMAVQPFATVSFEALGRLCIAHAPHKDADMLRRGSVVAALSVMTSLFFSGIRLALWLVLWQTAGTAAIVSNMITTIVSEVIVEGGVMQIYLMPIFTRIVPCLRIFYTENSIKCLLVYVSVTQLTEYLPPIVTLLLYLTKGADFKVTGLILVQVDDYRPYQRNIPQGLAVYLALEFLMSLGTMYVSRKTGFRHCWVWKTRRVLFAALHEALQFAICPLLTAVLLSEMWGEEGESVTLTPDLSLEATNATIVEETMTLVLS
eukprot:Rmarinus@m.20591